MSDKPAPLRDDWGLKSLRDAALDFKDNRHEPVFGVAAIECLLAEIERLEGAEATLLGRVINQQLVIEYVEPQCDRYRTALWDVKNHLIAMTNPLAEGSVDRKARAEEALDGVRRALNQEEG